MAESWRPYSNKMKVSYLLIAGLVIVTYCQRNDSKTQNTPSNVTSSPAINIIKPGNGVDEIVIGQSVKRIIGEVGDPLEVFSRSDSKLDSIFYLVSDTSIFLPYYFDFDTAYHFRNPNKYGLSDVYSKNGVALVLSFSYMFDRSANTVVDEKIRYFDKMAVIKKAFAQTPMHFVPKDDPLLVEFGIQENKLENLFYFEQGIQFDMDKGEMISFTLFSPNNQKHFQKFINQLSQK